MNLVLQSGNPWTPVPFNFGPGGGNTTWLLAYGNAAANGSSSTYGLYNLQAAGGGGFEQGGWAGACTEAARQLSAAPCLARNSGD
jgi:hypothetical protein